MVRAVDQVLAVSGGEPAGIGPDVVLSAFARREPLALPPFCVFADPAHLKLRAQQLGLSIAIRETGLRDARACFDRALPVVPLSVRATAAPGVPDRSSAAAVVEAIERAVAATLAGEASAVVTAPIAKGVLAAEGFAHPGHTEFLAELAGRHSGMPAPRAVMMLWAPVLAVVPVTIHVPLAAVPQLVTRDLIIDTAGIVDRDLRLRFGLAAPRLAIAGLNPHAGEGGQLGAEDDAIIRPAVEALRAAGLDAVGPLPADTLFHKAARLRHDVVLGMYHDQVLGPIKALAFEDAVNVTLGLPFVRTSPDHGTAFDIAGTGKADPASFVAALRLAARLAAAGTASDAAVAA
jgi:4-hydroxythreonine-4-phosphate dehydrogenase